MIEVYVVSSCRTAIGGFGGSLRETSAVELGRIVVAAALERARVAPEAVDEVLHGLNPVAELIGWGQAGVDPAVMGVGPVEASRRALAMAGLDVADLDLYEANEAFAAQALAVAGELGLDDNRLNVNGGAIALGHPIGASGARIVVTLLHELARREAETGLATLCVGGGMGLATVYKRVELIMRPAAASHRPGTAGRPRAVPGVDADPKTPSR